MKFIRETISFFAACILTIVLLIAIGKGFRKWVEKVRDKFLNELQP